MSTKAGDELAPTQHMLTCGPQCLCPAQELRIACTVAQQEREGGVSARVSPLAQVRLGGMDASLSAAHM